MSFFACTLQTFHRCSELRTEKKKKPKEETERSVTKFQWNFLQICPKCDEYFALLFSTFVCEVCQLEVCKDCIFIFYSNKVAICCPCYRDLWVKIPILHWTCSCFTNIFLLHLLNLIMHFKETFQADLITKLFFLLS